MSRLKELLVSGHRNEEGHVLPALGALVGTVGGILLGIGAANGNDALAIIGGIATGLGILAGSVLDHMIVEYNIFGRLEKLEGKK